MNFYVLNKGVDEVKDFFSVLPEEKRPRIVSDKDSPAAWDHQTDTPTVIVTDEPRTDTDAKELSLDGQAEDIVKEMTPEETQEPSAEDPLAESVITESKEESEGLHQETTQPLSFRDRGFKVGKIL